MVGGERVVGGRSNERAGNDGNEEWWVAGQTTLVPNASTEQEGVLIPSLSINPLWRHAFHMYLFHVCLL